MQLVLSDFIAGYFGGACGILIGHPLDTIKTWQQASNTKISSAMYDIIVTNNGLKGFFRGMFFPLITTGLLNSVFFGVYGNQLRTLQKSTSDDENKKRISATHIFIAGSSGGLVQSLVACPVEFIKVRRQARTCNSRGSWECLKNVIKTDGYLGLYRGFLPMLCRDVFPYGIYMVAYDYILKTLGEVEYVAQLQEENRRQKNSSVNSHLEMTLTTIAGSIAGVLSWVFVIPFDVVKTIIQAEENPKLYNNMFHCVDEVIKRHGWQILFRGSWMLLFRAVPVNTATFLGYEYFLEYCQKLH